MKKFLPLVLILALFASCSKDDTADPVDVIPEPVLLRKTVTRSGAGLNNVVTTFWEYNDTRLVTSYDSNGNFRNYTYQGAFISKIESYLSTGTLNATESFSYDSSGRLATSKVITANTGERYVYVYNPDSTVSITSYTGTAAVQNVDGITAKLFMQNGEVVKMETYFTTYTVTNDYQHDDKKKPTEKIVGFKEISYAFSNLRGRKGVLHNVVSDVQSSTEDATVHNTTKTYTYDAQGFPLTQVSTSSITFETYEVDYTYE